MGKFSQQLKEGAKNAKEIADALGRTGGGGGAAPSPTDPAAPSGGLTVQFNTTITEFGNASAGGGAIGSSGSITDAIVRFNRLADQRQKQLLDALRRSKDGIYVGIRSGEAG